MVEVIFTEDIRIKTQSNVILIAGCTSILGSLTINCYKNVDLSSLNTLTSVGKHLNISDNTTLTNLDGLNNIALVGQSLQITGNSALINLNGLSGIMSVGEGVDISNNKHLLNISSFKGLKQFIGNKLINSDNSQEDPHKGMFYNPYSNRWTWI